MHLLLEGSDLGDLLAEVRTQHGPAARVVRAERIRSGGVAGFFSKERYEVTVEMDGAGGDDETHVSHADDQAPAAGPAPEGLQVEEREALDFEALLAAADAAETAAGAAPAPVPAPAPRPRSRGRRRHRRRGGLRVRPGRAARGAARLPAGGVHRGPADRAQGIRRGCRGPGVIAQTGDDQHAASTGFAHLDEAADQADEAYAALAADLADELADEQLDEQVDDLADSGADEQADELADEEAAVAAFEAELLEQARAEIERAELERAEVERVAREREAAARAAAERALEEERMQQLEMERREAERAEHARREAVREQEVRREAARADVRRRQAERVSAPRPRPRSRRASRRRRRPVRSARSSPRRTPRTAPTASARCFAAGQGKPPRSSGAARPHRPISTESDSFARTMASMRQGATRTPATGVTGDVRSVTTPVRSVRPRPGHPDARPARTPEERVSDQFGTTNGATREGRGPARRPELRRPAAVEDQFADQFADQFGDQFGDRFEVERPVERPWTGRRPR